MNPNHPKSTEQKGINLLARKPLLAYFVLSYTFFWLTLTLFAVIALGILHLNLDQNPGLVSLIQIVGSWMPSLAAALVVGALEGREGVARLFGKLIRFRMAARWYLAALIPIGLVGASVSAYRLSGGLPQVGVSLTPAFWVNLVLVNFFTGPTGEEPGWRGFALPRLMQRFSPLTASLILGVLWSFWHLPLWLTSGYASTTLLLYILVFNIAIISLNLLMTWIYMQVPHTLVPMFLAHFTFNFCLMLAGPAGLGLGATLPLMTWLAGFTLITAIALWVWRDGVKRERS
jgi:membrane protease YdiL (CAAX protease family)